MDNRDSTVTIYLSDLWDVFVRRMVLIILAALICVAGEYLYATKIVKPLYNSTSTLYVLRQDESGDYSSTDFSLALNLVNDCTYMLKSHAVLDEVIEELELDMSYKALSDSISTRNPDNSRILEVSVKTGDPELSKKIVDKLCTIGAEKISDVMRMDQVTVLERGTLEQNPSNRVGMMRYIMFGALGAVLCYLAFVVAFVLDDKIKTEEDVKRYLQLSVLGEIPYTSASGRREHNRRVKAIEKANKTAKGGNRR